ncbi:MAG: cyclic nucleotide-binding domain-containing protein [Ardenticatenales bacterium]
MAAPNDRPPIDPNAVTGPVRLPGAVPAGGAPPGGGPALNAAPAPRSDGLTDADVALHLLGTEMFELVEPQVLRGLAPLFRATHVRAGEVIARQGVIDTTLWVLIDGALRLERVAADGAVEATGHRAYGAVVGIRGVFTDVPRPNSVVAESDAWLLAADRDALLRALRADPETFDLLVLPDAARANIEVGREEASGEGEYEVTVYRRHPLALAIGMAPPIGLVIALVVVGAGMSATVPPPAVVAAFAVAGIAVPAVWAWWAWLNWVEDRLIVTNQRVVMIETRPFIAADRREALMARIQDVQAKTPSLIARLFDYGTITINTASSSGKIVWHMAGRPDALRKEVFDQMNRARERAQAERRTWMEGQLRRAIGDGRLPGGAAAPGDSAVAAQSVKRPGGGVSRGGVSRGGARPNVLVRAAFYFLPRAQERQGGTYIWRKHWWILLRATIVPLALAAPATWLAAVGVAGAGVGATRAAAAVCVALYLWLWWRYEDWRNDQYILTDNHIIDIEALPLGLLKDQRQASLDAVQDVRYNIPNPLAMILRYGTVTIQTAADTGNFTFTDVANPARVQSLIFERINQRRARLEAEAEQKRADEMVQWLSTYHVITGDDGGAARAP